MTGKTESELPARASEPLIGKTHTELQAIAQEFGMPRFAAAQIAQWLYRKRVGSLDGMTNLSKAQRAALAGRYAVGLTPPVSVAQSRDGTRKYLFPTASGRLVESVYIPDGDRATLCVSSQVGCRMGCLFCMTGKQPWGGNLTAAEILNQVLAVPESDRLTNIVMMGMGEPLDNADAVLTALAVLTAPWGLAWSPHRITLSTIGHLGHLPAFLDRTDCHLAVSLHSPFADERLRLMPVERAYPTADLLALLRRYDFSRQRHLTFEYIVFRGLNDSDRHARALVRLLRGLDCKVNLIRFHAIPDDGRTHSDLRVSDLRTTDDGAMERLRDTLCRHGLTATIRASRGEDIFAACGMLSGLRGGVTAASASVPSDGNASAPCAGNASMLSGGHASMPEDGNASAPSAGSTQHP